MAYILIVDDDPDVRTYLTTLFRDHGHETDTAEDGVLGLEKAKSRRPDLITLDVIMPNQTGVKMYRSIVADPDCKDVPVLIVSGVTQYKELFSRDHKTMPKPAAFIEKPVDRDVLLEMINKLVSA
jgi:CheY-like chemotaxis protein